MVIKIDDRIFGEGTTLKVGTTTVPYMFDEWTTVFYALFWNDEKKKVEEVRAENMVAVADATSETLEKVRNYFFNEYFNTVMEKFVDAEREIKKGDIAKVSRGRVEKGKQGKVVVVMYAPYSMGWKTTTQKKLGIALSDEMVDVAAKNGKVYKNYKDMIWVWAKNCDKQNIQEIDAKIVVEETWNQVNANMAGYVK